MRICDRRSIAPVRYLPKPAICSRANPCRDLDLLLAPARARCSVMFGKFVRYEVRRVPSIRRNRSTKNQPRLSSAATPALVPAGITNRYGSAGFGDFTYEQSSLSRSSTFRVMETSFFQSLDNSSALVHDRGLTTGMAKRTSQHHRIQTSERISRDAYDYTVAKSSRTENDRSCSRSRASFCTVSQLQRIIDHRRQFNLVAQMRPSAAPKAPDTFGL